MTHYCILILLTEQLLSKIRSHQPLPRSERSLMHAAVAIIFRDTEQDTEFLMMQRAVHEDDPWAGQMSFPGGKIDKVDDSPLAAAKRETLEEVDVVLEQSEYIGQLNDLYGFRVGQEFNVQISTFVFKLNKEVMPVGNYEVADLMWVPMTYLNDPSRAYQIEHPRDLGTMMQGVCLCKEKDQIIWGLSLRVLVFLYDLLQLPMSALPDVEAMRQINNMG